MPRTILAVDDTRNIQLLLQEYLQGQGFDVSTAYDGREALEVFHSERPDLILLDVMMPNMDGFQFLSRIRTESDIPVIMITAKQQEPDIIRGFELGADDYIIKPFKLRELLMRVRAVLRRAGPTAIDLPVLQVGDITLDRSQHEVQKNETQIDLTPLEFRLLEVLMESAGRVIRREEMSFCLMDHGFSGSESTLKIHIRNLRLKLEDDISQPKIIETVFGIGYRFLEGEA